MGLPCTPRSTVRYAGRDEIVLSKEAVLQHALARFLQSSLSPHEEAAELLRMLREQPDPCATVRHLLGETVVGASDAGDQMAELAITRNRTCAKRPSTDWAAPILTLTLPPSPLPPLDCVCMHLPARPTALLHAITPLRRASCHFPTMGTKVG